MNDKSYFLKSTSSGLNQRPFGRWIRNTYIECVLGDISDQPGLQAIVYAASSDLGGAGRMTNAVHRRAGVGLAHECAKYFPLMPGSAAITGAHGLPNEYVIHCRGPSYCKDPEPEDLLARCYRQVLNFANANQVRSIGLPAISTGHNGFPAALATRIAIETVVTHVSRCPAIRRIRWVLADAWTLRLHTSALDEAFNQPRMN